MNSRTDYLKVALIAAGLISCAGPLSSSAMLLGDLTVHSHLGQPLRASIPIRVEPDEALDGRCFSLARPEGQGNDASYLTQARFDLAGRGGQFQLMIRTAQAINEPFLRLLVQGDCGQGHLSREFTLLLDPVEYSQAGLPSAGSPVDAGPQIQKEPERIALNARPDEAVRSSAASPYPREKRVRRGSLRTANPSLRGMPGDAPLPEGGVAQEPASRPAAPEGGFRLRLSTSGLDLSKVGTMTEAQRQQLREKQLLLDADDQVANTLSMKNRIRQLEEQINSMQKVLEQTSSRMQMSEKLALPAAPKAASAPPPAPAIKAPAAGEGWLENTSFRSMAGVGLILALLVSGWWRWRRRQAEVQLEAEFEQEFAASDMPQRASSVQPRPEQTPSGAEKPQTADQDDDFLHASSIFADESTSVTVTETESVLDEADLYLAYGWANRAIESLQNYLEKHPDDVPLWKKLFEIYSSQGMKQEFEQLALRCQATVNDTGLWVLVQKLGRQLDAANPLYLESPEEREQAASGEGAAEEADLPTLNAPLEFVLDEARASGPEADKDAGHLGLDPLFSDLDQNTKLLPDRENGDKARS